MTVPPPATEEEPAAEESGDAAKDDAAVDETTNELSKTDIKDESSSSSCPNSNWSKEKLTADGGAGKVTPALWGRPGHLTDAEADVYFKLKEVVDTRGGDFKDTVYSFGEEEGEVYALCRWCRARKFVFDDVMKMVEEATKCREQAKAADFYPDSVEALGCDTALYSAQYPQVYSGFAKNGCPVFYSRLGILNTDAVECVTTIGSILKYHWNVMMHDFKTRLLQHKKENPDFVKFECVCIMDLSNLTMAQLNSRTLTIVKEQSAIDSLCFPETLNKMYLVNSPRFFSATWTIIKGWLDPRTASKIEVISNRKSWEKSLKEYIDVDELPSDYGGTAPNTVDTLEKETFTGNLKRLHSEVLFVRGSGSITYDIIPDEEMEVSIYTRSTAGAKWTVSDAKNKKGQVWVSDIESKHPNDDPEQKKMPTQVKLTQANIKGPCSIEVKAKSQGSRFSSERFLVVVRVFKI